MGNVSEEDSGSWDEGPNDVFSNEEEEYYGEEDLESKVASTKCASMPKIEAVVPVILAKK